MKQNFRKNQTVTGKTPFISIGPFCTPHSICLNINFWYRIFVWNIALSILVLATKKSWSSFLKRVCIFQKICFKVKIFKMFKISSDCYIKTCRSLKRRAIFRSSRPEVFFKKDFLRNFAEQLRWSLFFNKVAGLRPATLLKKRLWRRCFSLNFMKYLRTPLFIKHLWWLLLCFKIPSAAF